MAHESPTSILDKRRGFYRSLPLRRLALRVVQRADRTALAEFHANRRLFWLAGLGPLRFVEYVEGLRDRLRGRMDRGIYPMVLEQAYDLTISKFTLLPDPKTTADKAQSRQIDCRFYFQAFVRRLEMDINPQGFDPLNRDAAEARVLQGLVTRHFQLSCREALRRQRRGWRLISWPIAGGPVRVWMPAYLTRTESLAWLTEHVGRLDRHWFDGAVEIQELVNEHFLTAGSLAYEEFRDSGNLRKSNRSDPGREFSCGDLAGAVAEEKAGHFERQRPAIRALGPEVLRQLVLQIFDELTSGTFDDGKVAKAFGLSKATFSRFAGSRWQKNEDERPLRHGGMVPDLWRNTARILAGSAVFMEAVRAAGVMDRVQTALNSNRRPKESTP